MSGGVRGGSGARASTLICNAFLLELHTNQYIHSVSLDHFKLLRVVGKGAFGKVRIVERKDTNLTFALKYLRKDEGAQSHPPVNLWQEES